MGFIEIVIESTGVVSWSLDNFVDGKLLALYDKAENKNSLPLCADYGGEVVD